MGVTDRLCTEQRRIASIMCQLLPSKRRHHSGFVSNTPDGRVHLLIGKRKSVLETRRQQWVLADLDRSERSLQNCLYPSPWTVKIHPYAVRTENAPATLQRAIHVIIESLKFQFVLVYLDDCVLFSNTISDHIGHLEAVLKLLRQADVILKLKKCLFLHNGIDYLGHVISRGFL